MSAAPPPTAFRPPAWAAPARGAAAGNPLDAAFAAGAALAALDGLVRQNAGFAGAWRRRLALRAAAACLEGAEERDLRDALALVRPGGDPGPAGRVYAAWRALASGRRFADADLGASPPDPGFVAATLEAHARGHAPAPIAAAAAAAAVTARWPRAALAFAVADAVLAARLGWPVPVPLLALERTTRSPAPAGAGEVCAAYARAAARACDLHAELGLAAARLEAVAPKLRAKGSKAAIAALLDEDALSGATKIPGLSERALRRLFDRLVALGALRELTGRASFRLYGL